jgi:hypothetical protein
MNTYFCNKFNLEHLGNSSLWIGDGTFKICSVGFYQFFTLHARVFGGFVPLVYALLSGKSSSDYNLLF